MNANSLKRWPRRCTSRRRFSTLIEPLESRLLLSGETGWDGGIPQLILPLRLSGIQVTAPNGQLYLNDAEQLSATGWNQFGRIMNNQAIVWSIDSGGVGTIDDAGMFHAGGATGFATIRATAGTISGVMSVAVMNAAPTIQTPATGVLSGNSATLSVLGDDDGGESGLSYTWSEAAAPAGAQPAFTINGDNAAKNTTVQFDRAGVYTFLVTVSDGSLTATSDVDVIVDATLSAILVTPASAALNLLQSTPVSATALDQFGQAMLSQPAFSWGITSGPGIFANGVYSSDATAGTALITASSAGISGTTSIVVSNAAPTIAISANTPNAHVAGSATTLSVLGADDGGESALSYTWSITASPSGSAPIFSINGSNAAKSVGVTFDRAGTYSFSVNISDGLADVTSGLTLIVDQTLTSIVVVPGASTLNLNQTTALSANAFDQFGAAITTPPAFTWSDQGAGSISGATFNAGTSAGTATIQAASASVTGSASISVTNAAPTVATAANAGTLNVVGTSTSLSVLGTDDGGESGLTYSWSATTKPTGANPIFSINGTNTAKNATVTFDAAGAYTFLVTISDGTSSVTSSVNLVVAQTLTSITVTAESNTINLNQSVNLSAVAYDQFGATIGSPTFSWSVSGVGSLTGASYQSGTTAGTAVVTASNGGISGTATITVTNATPTVSTPASAGSLNVTGSSTTLSALGADDGGESGLTYTWDATTQPTGSALFYSLNGTNAAKNTSVSFNRAGSYTFRVTISDGHSSTTSLVSLTVSATLTALTVTPGTVSLNTGGSTQLSATASDQFGQTIANPGTITWTVDAGGVGGINSTGLYTAGSTAGSAMVRASIGAISGTAAAQVTSAGNPATITTQTLTGFTDLIVTGTASFDTINIQESGTTFTITSNTVLQTITGNFQDLVVYAGSAGSQITVDSSVTINVRLYGGAGSDNLRINATGTYNTIVSIGGGVDTLTGNGISTYFWADSGDTVNSNPADITADRVHKITSFYQPWSTDPANPNYITTQLNGPNLADPTDSGSTHRGTGWSLFGLSPQTTDIRQGGIGDCFLLATLGSLAYSGPARIYRSAVDLGDGTFAVRFYRGGVESVVRVDADLSQFQASVSPSGGIWVPIFEKAYAFYRTGENTFASLNSGWMFSTLTDLECSAANIFTFYDDTTLSNTILTALAAGKALSVGTGSAIYSGAPLIASHAYVVLGIFYDSNAAVWNIQLRNPWGYDGTGNDGNPQDGIVTLRFDQLEANCSVVVSGT